MLLDNRKVLQCTFPSRREIMFPSKFLLILSTLLLAVLSAATAEESSRMLRARNTRFVASASGEQEIPNVVVTATTARVEVLFDDLFTKMDFKIR